ncbi:MAG: hypothetical protein ACF788_01435 [Novipirellula sp. JB048]
MFGCFANDLGRVINQGERDFPGAHFENCPREDLGQHDSIGIIGFINSLTLFRRGRRSGRYGNMAWEVKVGGSSFGEALKLVDQTKQAEIQ